MTQLLEITGRFINTRFTFPAADPALPPTIIADIHSPETSSKICVKGAAAPHELSKDLDYRFYGSWTNYFNKHRRKNERQFRFNSFVRLQPAGREAIIGYLTQHGTGFGLGKQRATRLWELFGSEAVTIARTDPDRVSHSLTSAGLTYRLNNAQLLAQSLADDHATEAIKLDLTGLVTGRGFPRTIINTVIQEWGNKAATIVRRDPYRLLKFSGCGFKKCDSMYLDLGLNPARLKRQALCAWYSLAQNTEGHTWFGWRVPDAYLRSNISGAGVKVERALELAERASIINRINTIGPSGPISQGEVADVRWFAERDKAENERLIAERVVELANAPAKWPSLSGLKLSEHQKEKGGEALRGAVCVLGGAPGCGKTWLISELIIALEQTVGLNNILVAGPTGKSAVRITENLQAKDIDLRARTWHSLIMQLDSQKETHFHQKVLIGDESSMLDSDLMAAIFKRIPAGSMLLLSGDVQQLPPVGHGAPLRDLIAAGVPYGELTEIVRNSGGIVETCAAIRDQKAWAAGGNLLLVDDQSQDKAEAIKSIYQQAKAEGLDLTWDVQVVCAVNEKSPLSRQALNKMLQAMLNNQPGEVSKAGFRAGDKVVCIKNGFYKNSDSESWTYRERITPAHKIRKDPVLKTFPRGYTPEMYRAYIQSADWKIKSKTHLFKRNYVCERCGEKANQVHHNDYTRIQKELESDLEALCGKCHHDEHNKESNFIHIPEKQDFSIENGEVYVANGELGRVIECDDKSMIIHLDSPTRTIQVYFGAEGGCTFELGYAMSVHKCVHPETLVETVDGLMPIRNVPPYGIIGTPYGPREYAERFSYQNCDCLEITTKDGNSITATLDHKCERWNGVKFEMCNASELKEGDYVRTALFASIEPSENCALPQHHGSDVRCVDIKLPEIMTAELAEFLGLCVADGCVFRAGIRLGKRHPEVVDRFESLAENLFGIKALRSVSPSGGMYIAELHSTMLRDWVLNLGGCYPKHKHIPECVMKSRREIHAAFIRGLFEDGTVNMKSGFADHIEWSTCFPRLLNEVRVMLNRLGIICGRNSQKRGRGLLYIYGFEVEKFRVLIGFISQFKNERLNYTRETSRYMVPVTREFIDSANLPRYIKQNARKRGTLSRASVEKSGKIESMAMLFYHYSPIKEIRKVVGPTMCVTVPDGNRFMQNGFPWGNSQGSDWPWVVVMLDDYPGAKMVCDRSWLYTAISRAKSKCWMVGKKQTAMRMCKVSKIWHRKTFLKELILMGKARGRLADV